MGSEVSLPGQGVSLTAISGGSTGPTGPTGATGATGPAGATGPSGGSSAVLSTGKITLSSAQILALGVTPVPIIAAPGAGKIIQVLFASYELVYGSATYEGEGGLPSLYYGTDTTTQIDPGWGQGLTATQSSVQCSNNYGNVFTNTQIANQSVVLNSPGTVMTGDGAGSITVLYTVVTL